LKTLPKSNPKDAESLSLLDAVLECQKQLVSVHNTLKNVYPHIEDEFSMIQLKIAFIKEKETLPQFKLDNTKASFTDLYKNMVANIWQKQPPGRFFAAIKVKSTLRKEDLEAAKQLNL